MAKYPDQSRNLNPTPEARLAIILWSQEYAFEQRGGTMDFWDSLSDRRKLFVRRVLSDIASDAINHNITLEDMAGVERRNGD